ncbi:MAG: YicC/YloC family endoribonuclease [Kiloniellales bacterium]
MAKSRPLASMTGFARREGGDARVTWSWEIKSVNGRSLDVRCRVPSGHERLEAAARAALPKVCARGNVSIALSVGRGDVAPGLRVNRDLLDQVIALAGELETSLGSGRVAPPRLDGLLAIRGVLETANEDEPAEETAAREAAMQGDLEAALDDLVAARRGEGTHLKAAVEAHLTTVETLTAAAAACAATQPDALRERLKTQVEALLDSVPALSEDRLAQEAALLIARGDVREELDRLGAHVAAARALLAEGGTVGRRLDFLCQEFNREANTLCSKSSDVGLTRIGLDLKSAIEQLREQVQNIE